MQTGHDQDIRRPRQPDERVGRAQIGVERHIGRHLAVVLEIRLACVQQRHRLAQRGGWRAGWIAEIGVRHERHPGLMTHGARLGRALFGNVRQLDGIGAVVNSGIGHEHRAPARDHDRDTEQLRVGPRIEHVTDIVEADGVASRLAGHHGVGLAVHHHAGGKHVAVLVHQPLAVAIQKSSALEAVVEEVGIDLVAFRQPSIMDLQVPGPGQAEPDDGLPDRLLAPDQDRRAVADVAV